MDKKALINTLKENVVTLQFLKKDGTTRTMTCTQNREFLSENADKLSYIEPKGVDRNVDEKYAIVWDIENEGWRTVNSESTEILKIVSTVDYAANLK